MKHYGYWSDVLEAVSSALEHSVEVEDARVEYDIEAIADEVFEFQAEHGAYVRVGGVEEFWESVEKHAL